MLCAFTSEIVERHPEWATHITRTPNDVGSTWTACAEIPSPTGDNSRQLLLWLEGSDPSIGFGGNWHMHAQNMEEFWEYVEAIVGDQLVIGVDVGGEHDGFEDVIDLRDVA